MVQAKATQVMLGEPPSAALISNKVFAGNTQPRYPEIWARHVAYHVLDTALNRRVYTLTTIVPMKAELV